MVRNTLFISLDVGIIFLKSYVVRIAIGDFVKMVLFVMGAESYRKNLVKSIVSKGI